MVELFTSQGCSSCPPADALFTKLSADPSLITLSFPVDYWDYLGWKDTFAKSDYTARQRAYAAVRGDRAVYTPQAVVNGREHVVGSDEGGIQQAISGQLLSGGLSVPISTELSGDAVVAHIGNAVASTNSKATVWLLKYARSETVAIGRGENGGRNVTYSHVVKEIQPIGMWKGQEMTIELPRSVVTGSSDVGYVLLLQCDRDGRVGPILGAITVEPGNPS